MKETAEALLSKNQNEPSAARALEVSLDRADNVIEGGTAFEMVFDLPGGRSLVGFEGSVGLKFVRNQFLSRGMRIEIKTPTL